MIKEEIDKLLKKFEENELILQAIFVEIVNKEKEKIIHLNENTFADYSVRINNALSFLKASDDTLTDETAHIMLEDFEKDYKTMSYLNKLLKIAVVCALLTHRILLMLNSLKLLKILICNKKG